MGLSRAVALAQRLDGVAALARLVLSAAVRRSTPDLDLHELSSLEQSVVLVSTLTNLFDNNREWARRTSARDPEFFRSLSAQQVPKHVWIGCSDSRVPANDIVGLLPGELFVHRNVANVVVHSDLNCLSVLQYAVDVLKVEHVIVCGHYGCGGVRAAYDRSSLGLIDNWLRHVQDVRDRHDAAIRQVAGDEARIDILCALNVVEQVRHVCHTTVVQDAWRRQQSLTVHGWIYSLHDGLLRDLCCTTTSAADIDAAYTTALGYAMHERESS